MRSKLALGGLAVAVAFLFATNPVVVAAAAQITGAQVKNNSITGQDVREKTLKGVNAKKLDGKKSSVYANPTYRYVLPVEASAAFQTYQFPGLPPGTYVASYSAVFVVAAVGKAVLCRFEIGGSHELMAYGAPAQFGAFSTVSAAGVLSGTAPTLFCNSQSTPGDNWSVYNVPQSPSVVTFARVDTTTTGTTTSTRTITRTAAVAN